MHALLEKIWYQQHGISYLLWPFSGLYQVVQSFIRCYKRFIIGVTQLPVPVVVVGNLTVGGTGKTPLVIALVQACQAKGLRVGVISRGYKSQRGKTPYLIQTTDTASMVGDEPLLISKKTGCSVVIAPNRVQAARLLLKQSPVDLIICDDGLQHETLGRALEIAVIDGMRGLGNERCLPAGPLRESKKRLKTVDFIVVNEGVWPGAYPMTLQPQIIVHLQTKQTIPAHSLPKKLMALAAIGNPKRFFYTLKRLGIAHTPMALPDHSRIEKHHVPEGMAVIMTEKDAIKYQKDMHPNWYMLTVEAVLKDDFWQAFWLTMNLKD